jgi:MFS family permease
LLRDRIIGPAIAIAVVGGTLMFGVTTYVPLWVQSVQGGSPYDAGIAVAAMSFGWPIMSAISGFIMVRVGYERLVLAGGLGLLAGTAMLALGPSALGFIWTGAASLVIGAGMGTFSAPLLIVIQSTVEWGQRGAVTALNQFSRTIGGAIGVSVMGVILQRYVAGAQAPLQAQSQLQAGLHAVFVVLLALALVIIGLAIGVMVNSGGSRQFRRQAPATVQGSTSRG